MTTVPTPRTPEQLARERIDTLLVQAGWSVQDREEMNLGAAGGVAVREFPTDAGPCDYLLFVGGKPAGVIEAKREGVTLTAVEAQTRDYAGKLPAWMSPALRPLPFLYESTGAETRFTNLLRMKRADLDEFVACFNPKNRNKRKPTWSEKVPGGRWRAYPYDELVARDKCSLDVFWLKDESLLDAANLPDPDIIAAEIAEDLRSALEQIEEILADVGPRA